MKYYKVLKDDKVIDVLLSSEISYLKYNMKHKCMFNAKGINDAQAIYSSDRKYIWHPTNLLSVPVDGYDTVELIEIDVYEYDRLKMLHCASVEEIIDQTILNLIEGGIL